MYDKSTVQVLKAITRKGLALAKVAGWGDDHYETGLKAGLSLENKKNFTHPIQHFIDECLVLL